MIKKIIPALMTMALSTSFAGSMGQVADCPPAPQYAVGPYFGASIGPITNTTILPAAYQGLEGTISVGVGYLNLQNLYLAGEFFGGSSATAKNMPLNNSRNRSIRSTWQYGFGLIPGLLINDKVLGYARLGVLQANFPDAHHSRTGLQVGVGAQTNVWKNLDLRSEYIYSQYKTFTTLSTPLMNQFNIGLVYKFV